MFRGVCLYARGMDGRGMVTVTRNSGLTNTDYAHCSICSFVLGEMAMVIGSLSGSGGKGVN